MSTEYEWLRDIDRAALLLGALGQAEAGRRINDPRDFAAFCETHRLRLEAGEVAELKAVLRV